MAAESLPECACRGCDLEADGVTDRALVAPICQQCVNGGCTGDGACTWLQNARESAEWPYVDCACGGCDTSFPATPERRATPPMCEPCKLAGCAGDNFCRSEHMRCPPLSVAAIVAYYQGDAAFGVPLDTLLEREDMPLEYECGTCGTLLPAVIAYPLPGGQVSCLECSKGRGFATLEAFQAYDGLTSGPIPTNEQQARQALEQVSDETLARILDKLDGPAINAEVAAARLVQARAELATMSEAALLESALIAHTTRLLEDPHPSDSPPLVITWYVRDPSNSGGLN